MVQIITDLSTLITAEESKERDIEVVPLSISILRRSGRLTPLAAKFGSALQIKPIMQQTPDGTRLDTLEIAHIMKEAFEKAKLEVLELSPVFVTQGGPKYIAIQYIKL